MIAIELTPRFHRAALRFRNEPQVEVLEADILEFDFGASVLTGRTRRCVRQSSLLHHFAILLRIFAARAHARAGRAVVMMQREVAPVDAAPGCREYGLLSATTQMNARVRRLHAAAHGLLAAAGCLFNCIRWSLRLALSSLAWTPRASTLSAQMLRAKAQDAGQNLRAAGHASARGYSADQLRAAWPCSVIPPLARAESLALETLAALYRALARFRRRGRLRAQRLLKSL